MMPMGGRCRGWRLPVLAAALLMALALVGRAPEASAASALAPDRQETARLIWTTLIAVDHANRTGNYSVLRDLAAPSFRDTNNAARLAGIFAKFRARDIGLRRVVLASPVYAEPPKMLDNGLYRVKGNFVFRPVGISFDLLFQQVDGEWLLYGVSIAPVEIPAPPADGPTKESGTGSGG
jgi:hypothetical protein